jgi:hypothetical protein
MNAQPLIASRVSARIVRIVSTKALFHESARAMLASFERMRRRSSSPYFRSNTSRRRSLAPLEIRFACLRGDS